MGTANLTGHDWEWTTHHGDSRRRAATRRYLKKANRKAHRQLAKREIASEVA